MKRTNKMTEISLLRVISMFMIIFCHLFNFVEMPFISQFLNVGVYIFLLISGYLYSNKDIEYPKKWIISRWKKICIPVIIWAIAAIIYETIIGKTPSFICFLIYLFNLQGFSWIFTSTDIFKNLNGLEGLGNLWFISIIMICYLITIIIKKHRVLEHNINKILTILIILFPLMAIIQINIIYFIAYIVGYIMGKTKIDKRIKVIYATIILIVAIIVRLIIKSYFDNTFIYSIITVGITHLLIALAIFIIVTRIAKSNRVLKKISESKVVSILDTKSYYYYITHNYYLHESFGLKAIINGLVPQLLLFMILTVTTTELLFIINRKIIRNEK